MLVMLLNEKIYGLTLTIKDLDALNQLGLGIDYFLNQLPSTQDLALFFTVALQASDLKEGYQFIDDFYEDGNTFDKLLELIPKLYVEMGIIVDADKDEAEMNSENQSLEEIIKRYLQQSLSLGLTEKHFYSMTLGEIRRFSESIEPKRNRELKERAIMDYAQSELIALNVACIFSKKAKVPLLEEVYGFLYSDDDRQKMKEIREEQQQVQVVQEMQANMMAWVEAMNAKRKHDD